MTSLFLQDVSIIVALLGYVKFSIVSTGIPGTRRSVCSDWCFPFDGRDDRKLAHG